MFRAISSRTMSLSFEKVKQFRIFATLVVGIATILCCRALTALICGSAHEKYFRISITCSLEKYPCTCSIALMR